VRKACQDAVEHEVNFIGKYLCLTQPTWEILRTTRPLDLTTCDHRCGIIRHKEISLVRPYRLSFLRKNEKEV
jgi:hypothetical protein